MVVWGYGDPQLCASTTPMHMQDDKRSKKVGKKRSGQCELYSHHKDARGTKQMSKPRLKRWHKLENAYTKNFSRLWMRIQVNGPTMSVSTDPPPLSKEETWPSH